MLNGFVGDSFFSAFSLDSSSVAVHVPCGKLSISKACSGMFMSISAFSLPKLTAITRVSSSHERINV